MLKYFVIILTLFISLHTLWANESWQELPLPSEKFSISDVGIEPGGVLWMMGDNSLYYFNGQKFVPPQNAKLKSGQYLTKLYGGNDRGLYASQRGTKEHQGKLYRLIDGTAEYLTDFYYDVTHEYPGIYVSQSGHLFNWGQRFLAVYTQGAWKRVEAPLSLKHTLVFDRGDWVHFYYNGHLVSVHGNKISQLTLSVPINSLLGQKRVHGVLWGADRMLLLEYGAQRVHAYHLDTGRKINTEYINGVLGNRRVYDCLRLRDGSVWVLAHDRQMRSYVFYQISPKNEITRIDETAKLKWDNSRCWQFPRSVLHAKDDSLWLGMPHEGIAQFKNGTLHHFNWKSGVDPGTYNYIIEGDNKIYAASRHSLYQSSSQNDNKAPDWTKLWTEYQALYSPVRDMHGNIWMCLSDRPGEISCWDGENWEHIPVSFDTTKISRVMADDLGRILLQMSAYPDGCYALEKEQLTHYSNMEEMLVDATVRGAKRFDTGSSYQGCFVDKDKIWFGYHNYNNVHYYTGNRWDSFGFSDDVYYLFESSEHGILIRTQGGKFYTYDTGQLVLVPTPHGEGYWILGPKGMQPFDSELLADHPNDYVPIKIDSKQHLLVPDKGGDWHQADPLPSDYGKQMTRGFSGGHWSGYSACPIYRIFGNRVILCDFNNTPVMGRKNEIRKVMDDRKHNLIVDAGWYSGARHVFLKRAGNFIVQAKQTPTTKKLSAMILLEISNRYQQKLRMFYRFKGGQWRETKSTGVLKLDFPHEGFFAVEFTVMGPQGEMGQQIFKHTFEVR